MSFVSKKSFKNNEKQLVNENMSTLDLTENIPVKHLEPKQKQSKEPLNFDSSIFRGIDLTQLEGLEEIKSDRKSEDKYGLFVSEIKKLLSHFDIGTKKYNHKLLLFVCQVAEDVFSKSNSGELKERAVIEAVAPFFDGNEQLISTMIQMVYPQIIKSNMLRRFKKSLCKFFFGVRQRLSHQ